MTSDSKRIIEFSLFYLYLCISFFLIFSIAQSSLLVNFSFLILTTQTLFLTFYVGGSRLSLIKCYFLFQFLFMSLIPSVEFNLEHVYWGGEPFETESYLYLNIVLFITNFFAVFVYRISWRGVNNVNEDERQHKVSLLSIIGLVFLSFISLCFVYYVNNFSVISMFVRAGEFKDTASNSSSVLLIMTYLGKFIPFFCLMAAISVNNKNRLLVCYLFLVLLVCVFPFGNARFLVASVYIPLLIICYPKILKGVKGISLFIFSLLVLFPFFDNFRNLNDNEEINFIPSFDFFLNGHFDSYQSFLRVLENDVVTYGRQLLGVIFFFIPRAVWSDKPSGSGYYISELFNYGFSNISMNYFGEGYI
ncbi:hypothetical protein D8T39_22385, partial [Vibrio vulnificus]